MENLWGETVQPKQKKEQTVKKVEQDTAPTSESIPVSGRTEYYQRNSCTSDSSAQHIAYRIEMAVNYGVYNTNSIKDIRKNLEFEEKKRLELSARIDAVEKTLAGMRGLLEEISAVVNEMNGHDEEEDDDRDFDLESNEETNADTL